MNHNTGAPVTRLPTVLPYHVVSPLITIDDFENFADVRDSPAAEVSASLLKVVRSLDEREELEPYVRSILFDSSSTPHGPAELVDILTHKVSVAQNSGLAAFILKGKSFGTVRPSDVAHQIYRLEKIKGLKYAVFAASGTILDAAKEQFCSTAERLGVDYAIFDANDLGRLFVAYGFFCPRDSRRIVAGRCRCGYSPKKRILNHLQTYSLKALADCHEIGQRAGAIVLPPGTGKTRIAAEDARKLGAKHVLYIAHTHEILDVAQSEFEAVFGRRRVCRHAASSTLRKPRTANLVTVQLLSRNIETAQLHTYDYVIVDEFHHSAAKSYRQILAATKPDFLLGMTATPFRGDNQDILQLCGDNLVVNFELRTGIESGILSPYHYFGCFDDINYSNIRHNGARYDVGDLEKALIIPERDTAIVAMWRKYTEGKPSIAFCCSHNHAARVAQSFREAGIPAEVYLSSTPLSGRQDLTRKLARGRVKVLCTVDILNEGSDMPFIECLLFLRPTESKRIFYQQLGRGLRRFVGKSHCTVIDFIGNFKNAYKIVEYQGLLPVLDEEAAINFRQVGSRKDVLNLPLGCEVHFDDRVIDVFASQTLDPRYATRHNIGRILLYQYERLSRQLGRHATKRDVDRYSLLDSRLYAAVFQSWVAFQRVVGQETLSITP
ncbi:MAG: DEAD/DEAH box helicase [Acidobacteriia bacterium]|nr:DEAD/DEAH box helicase [Terriglobia bacterium]